MIPYEELAVALARWRARHGLPTGLADYIGEPAPAAAMRVLPPSDHSRDDVVEIGDDLLDAEVEEPPVYVPAGNHAGNAAVVSQDDLIDQDEKFPELGEESTQKAVLADVSLPDPVALPAAPDGKPQARGRRGTGRRRRK